MKNVLNVVNVFFAIPYFFGNQFEYMKSQGFDVHVICSPSEHLEQYAKNHKFIYKEIPVTRSITPLTDLKSLYKICKYIQKNDIDIIVGHTAKGSLLAVLAGKIMRVKDIIIFRHGIPYDRHVGFKKKMAIWRTQLVAYLANKIVVVSHSLAELSLEIKLNPEQKQYVLGKGSCGGIDTINKFNPSVIKSDKKGKLQNKLKIENNDFVIGFCGRLETDKGIIELVYAFELLINKYPNKKLKLLLIGMFDVRNPLNDIDKNRILNNPNIIYTGYIKDDLEYYYSLMTVGVLPSYHEGLGMFMLEAQAMQIPVITTKSIGCIDTIIENETGLYTTINAQDICNKIETYFDDSLRTKFGLKAREMIVANFNNKIIWPEIIKVYNS